MAIDGRPSHKARGRIPSVAARFAAAVRGGAYREPSTRDVGSPRVLRVTAGASLKRTTPPMGDKSPKSKDKNKKQGAEQKRQTKAAADAKRPASGAPAKKGK